jgi:hypothetical protein
MTIYRPAVWRSYRDWRPLVRAGIPVLGIACAVLVGVRIGRTGSPMPFVLLAGALSVGVAAAAPRLAIIVGTSAMALPYTWGPEVPKLGYGIGIVVGLTLVLASIPTLREYRPNALDLAVLAFAVTPALSSAVQGEAFHVTTWVAPVITLPYFGFRLTLRSEEARAAFPPTLIATGIAVSAIGISEGLTGHNPVVHAGALQYTSSGQFVTSWNVPDFRDGHLRALATFGHPIAFGMFLLIPIAFALARGGLFNLAAAAAMLFAQGLTFSRGPWAGSVAVVALLLLRGGRARLAVIVAALAATAAAVGPVHDVLVQTTSSSTEAGNSAYYRVGLLTQALNHATLLGHPFIDLQTAIPNYVDVTSLLAGTLLQTGLVGVSELLVIVCLAVVALVRALRADDTDRFAATAALVAQLVGLLAVTLITNYEFFFWALVAYVSASGRWTLGPDTPRTKSATSH